MGIVDQKHHLPRQSPSAGYGKLSNGELFLIFISGSGKNPTKYSFVKIIHNFFPSHSCLFFPPSILCVRNGLEQIYFPELGEDPVSCEGVEIELWVEQHWDEVQKICLCWLISRDVTFQWRLFRKTSAAVLQAGLQCSPFENFGQELMKIYGAKVLKSL